MRRIAGAAAMALCATLLLGPAAGLAAEPPAGARDISGRYRWKGDTTKTVTLIALTSGVYRAVGDGWEGAGIFENDVYWGVFRPAGKNPETYGTHRGVLQPDGSLAVHGELAGGVGKPFDDVWVPERGGRRPRQPGPPVRSSEPPVAPPVVVVPPDAEQLPKFGDYVYIDELPEAVTKVPPEYPEAARAARIEGTVLVQSLVGADGRVKDTRISKSVPGLDEAAAACASRWIFKPAMAGGKPVAVWVAVPIRFTLH